MSLKREHFLHTKCYVGRFKHSQYRNIARTLKGRVDINSHIHFVCKRRASNYRVWTVCRNNTTERIATASNGNPNNLAFFPVEGRVFLCVVSVKNVHNFSSVFVCRRNKWSGENVLFLQFIFEFVNVFRVFNAARQNDTNLATYIFEVFFKKFSLAICLGKGF